MRNNLKNSFHSKKGVSLVVCIALSIVLFMTTATFVSIALLQQNDTNSQLNTRQAYISAKSAMDTAKEILSNSDKFAKDDKIKDNMYFKKLPDVVNTSYFYVMYNDTDAYGNSFVNVQQFNTYDNLEFWLESNKSIEIIGDSYIKITKTDNTGNYTATAVSTVNKYSVNDSERQGDLSINFTATTTYKPVESYDEYKLYVKKPSTGGGGSPSAGSDFLMAGAQTNYSLLTSYKNYCYGWNGDSSNLLSEYQNLAIGDIKLQSGIGINRETGNPKDSNSKILINSQFPIVYHHVAYCDTNADRQTYTAYNQGVFFLGNFNTPANGDWRGYSNGISNAAYFTDNASFSTEYKCTYIVIGNNMYARSNTKDGRMIATYAGDGASHSNVYVYVARNDVKFITTNDSGQTIETFTLKKGWYRVNSGSDLFCKNTYNGGVYSGTTPVSTDYVDTIYTQAMNNKIHSAYEDETIKNGVDILTKAGEFINNENSYSTIKRTSAPTDNWQDYIIYCAPNKMPSSPSSGKAYYDMYSGKSGTGGSFNFCWYNVNDATVKSDVNMAIHSSTIVLTIGPDTGEVVGKQTDSSYSWLMSSRNESGLDDIKKASNIIVGEEGSSFYLKPYWDESSATLIVKSDFIVRYKNGSDYTEYIVKEGEYEIKSRDGINLFSDAGKNLIASDGSMEISSKDAGWVDSDGTIHQFTGGASPQVKEDDGVYFEANKGSLSDSAVYKAKSITARFTDFNSANPLKTNNAELQAQYISIGSEASGSDAGDSNRLAFYGTALYINSQNGNIADYRDVDAGREYSGAFYELDKDNNQTSGAVVMLHVADYVDLVNELDGFNCTLKPGYYIFTKNINTDKGVNILSPNSWKSVNYYDYSEDFDEEVIEALHLSVASVIQTGADGSIKFDAGKTISYVPVTEIKFSDESRYY